MSNISIILVGDVMIGRSFNTYTFPLKSLQYPWGNTLPILQNSDIIIGNLETTITNSEIKWPNKTFNYKLLPQYAETLKKANFSYCSLANNHILDYQETGMNDTINNLDELEIKHAGAGENIEEAMQPVFITKNNIIFGFLSASDHYAYWEAKNNKPGIWYIPIRNSKLSDWKIVFEKVREVKKECDVLIFSLHWNFNYVDQIDKIFISFGHKLIDNGVDIIHGHSPHHILPMERYGSGIIFYSLGDFIDDYVISQKYRNDLSIMIKIIVDENLKIKIDKIYPTYIKHRQVNLLKSKSDIDFVNKQLKFNK